MESWIEYIKWHIFIFNKKEKRIRCVTVVSESFSICWCCCDFLSPKRKKFRAISIKWMSSTCVSLFVIFMHSVWRNTWDERKKTPNFFPFFSFLFVCQFLKWNSEQAKSEWLLCCCEMIYETIQNKKNKNYW